jgi:hypothetical protein
MGMIDSQQATSVGNLIELFQLDLRPISFDVPKTSILNNTTLTADATGQ